MGCGSSTPDSNLIARLGSQTISRDTYRQNLNYAIRFYQSAYGSQGGLDAVHCVRPSSPCAQIRDQLLRRLLEEDAVIEYADRHRIHLSSVDQTEINAQMASIDQAGSVIAQMIARKQISRPFLRSLLETEFLIHRVETRVIPVKVEEGFAYHVRTITIPFAPGGRGLNAYRRAVTLATDGRPIPRRALVRTVWIIPPHLAANVRKLVAVAQPGQYVGPFKRHRAYLVVQLLGSGLRRYSRTTLLTVETSYFHRWIDRMLTAERPICFSPSGKTVACPGPID